MDYKKIIRPFKRKIIRENLMKAFLFALMTGAAVVFVVSMAYHIAIKYAPWKLLLITFGGVFLLSFVSVFLVRFYPNNKRVANRIDEMGLKERALTMLEYQNVDSEMARLQREDACKHISQTKPKQMRSHIRKREWIACLISVCLAITMLFVPYDILSFTVSASERLNEEQEEMVKELIEQLREEVKKAEVSDELKEQLNEIVDELEEQLQKCDSELERAAKIEEAKQAMEELLGKELTKDIIGKALQMYDLTKPLGVAINNGDTQEVSTELDNLEIALNTYQGTITTLSETIIAALTDSGVGSEDDLYVALNEFATTLREIANAASRGEDVSDNLAKAFDIAEEAINAALEAQAKIEGEITQMQEALAETKDEILGNEQEESEGEQRGEEQQGEKSENGQSQGQPGEQPNGEMANGEMLEGERPLGVRGEGNGEDEGTSMTESIYDPISGDVSYGDVFAVYYAEYLKALEDGEISQELQEILDKYFSLLN